MRTITLFFCAFALEAQHGPRLARSPENARNLSDQSITLPLLGFVELADQGALRAIVGIPGASRLSEPLALPEGVERVFLAPSQTYALAQIESGLLVVNLQDGAVTASAVVPGVEGRAARVEFSPDGGAAAVVGAEASVATVITGLPATPRVSWSAQVASATRLALSRDGTSLAMAADGGVLLLRKGLPAVEVYRGGEIGGMEFHPRTDSLLISDTGAGTAWLVESLDTLPAARALATGQALKQPGAVAFSRDGSTAFVSDLADGAVVRIDTASGLAERTVLGRPVREFRRLELTDTFLLSSPDIDTPAWAYSGAGSEGRAFFIPGIPSSAQQAAEDGRN